MTRSNTKAGTLYVTFIMFAVVRSQLNNDNVNCERHEEKPATSPLPRGQTRHSPLYRRIQLNMKLTSHMQTLLATALKVDGMSYQGLDLSS